MKSKLGFLALGLVALLGSLLGSSQHISAYAATDRLSSSRAAGPNVVGSGKAPLGSGIPAPGTVITYTTYLPLVMKNYVQGIYGYLTQGGAPIGGISLHLRFWNGSSYSTVATTVTNSAGFYVFSGIPALGGGQSYYVRYSNSEYNNSRLSFWGSANVTSYTPSSTVSLGTSDLANVLLAAPSPGATVALPYFFQWTRRTATPLDSYFLELFGLTDSSYAKTSALGYVNGVSVNSLPPGFYPYVLYGWDVGLVDSNFGIGYSYYYRTVMFTNYGLSTSGPLDMAPQSAGRRLDRPPRDHPEQ